MEIKTIKIKDLATNDGQIDGLPKNPRQIRDHRYEKLKKSIEDAPEMLQLRELLVYPHGGKFVIIGGNMRYRACKEIGYKELPCKVLDAETPVEKLRQYAIKDNENFGEYDWDCVANEWDTAEMEDWGVELPTDWGAELDGEEIEQKEIVEDEIPENAETKCKKGDIWQLGNHRLLCGDSTKAEDVARLMNGERADLVHTDPPYGMALDTDYSKIKGSDKSPKAMGYKWDKVIGDDKDFDPRPLFAMLDDVKEQFWWGCDYYFECLPRGGSLLVWQKRDKADAEMIGNDFEICWSKTRHKKATFWKRWVGFDSIEKGDKRVHPTQKPVALCGWIIESHSKEGGIVLDLFGGSGSTLIACEQLNRTCYMMELDPHYCDVIIARWEKLSGGTAVKIEDV